MSTPSSNREPSLSEGRQSPRVAGTLSIREVDEWTAQRDSGRAIPLFVSPYTADQHERNEFNLGAQMTGLLRGDRVIAPQSLQLVDVLAGGRRNNVVLFPRQSGKTSTINAWALGRAASRNDYRIAIVTGVSGSSGRTRFREDIAPYVDDWITRLEEASPDMAKRLRPRVFRGGGSERVEFQGRKSTVVWASSYKLLRGAAYDVVIIDEAGEPDPMTAEDILGTIGPTLDARSKRGSMLVIAGTAGDYKGGNILHDMLARGREDGEHVGILEYAFPEGTTIDDIATWEQTEAILLDSHPGIDVIATLDAVRGNYETYPAARFLREYGGIFGDANGGTALIKPADWEAAALDGEYPSPPRHFGLAIACHLNGTAASIVAAWREKGQARALVLDHRDGTRWVAARAAALSLEYDMPIIYDGAVNANRVVAEEIGRMNPRPRMEPQDTKHATTAASLLVRDIETGALGHWNQPALTAAALGMVRRKIGPNGWGLGRPNSDADITAAEALALALRWYDEHPARERIGIVWAA